MKTKIILFLIILIAGFLRFYQLAVNPPSLTWDEAAWGYNAYSLGLNGKDEFGRFLPFDYLESFGDFKPPVYAYLDILPVKIFGLSELAVRIPSALFGILSVFFTYLLTRRIFHQSKYSKYYALLTAFLLAISPWHILLSRAAFEANVASFFVISGAWAFLKGVQQKALYMILSVIPFSLAFYTFNSSRVFVPLLLLILSISYFKQLLNQKRTVIISLLFGLLLIAPIFQFLISPQARLRYNEVNIFSNIEIITTANQEIINDNNAPWSKIIHNRRFLFAKSYMQHYFDNLSFEFLFIKGDGNPKFSIRSMGQMYLWELPFLIAGIILLIKKKEKKWWIIFSWLLLAITPAAVARETPHALRIENSLPMLQILTAYGIINSGIFINKLQYKLFKIKLKNAFYIIFIFMVLLSLGYFAENYFLHYPKQFSSEWQYGYKDAVKYISENQKNYKNIFISKHQGRPYIYLLFYMQYDPFKYLKEAEIARDAFGFVDIKKFDKFYFSKDNIPANELGSTLFIDSPFDVPPNAKIQKIFYSLKGDKAFVAYTI